MSDAPRAPARRRVLPADELRDVQAFRMPALGGDDTQARAQAALERRLAQARADGRKEGYAAGVAAGRAEGEAQGRTQALEELARRDAALGSDFATRLAQLVETVGTELRCVEERLADELTGFCVALAHKALQHTVATDPEVIGSVVRAGVERIRESGGEITCRFNADDHAAIERALAASGVAGNVRLLPSAQVDRGGCILETADALLDLTLEQRWQRAIASAGVAAPEVPAEEASHD